MSKQPRDDGNEAIPVLGLRLRGGQNVTFQTSTSNTSQQISDSVRVVTLYATADAYVETHGVSTVVPNAANAHFLPASIPYDISLGFENDAVNNDKFVTVLGVSGSGTLYISERE